MPLVTRDWGSLAQLSAGVNTDAPSNGSGGNGTADAGSSSSAYFRVNGVDEWQNDFRLNGINDNIEFYGGNYTGTNAAIVPPPDAIQEFTLQSGDFSAEFGHSTGGIINASLKSGTNSVHGDLWEYVRNNDLNANYFFNTTGCPAACKAKPIPSYHQNLFGFTAGGPVVIPHVIEGKNRLFWFIANAVNLSNLGLWVLQQPQQHVDSVKNDPACADFLLFCLEHGEHAAQVEFPGLDDVGR